MTSALVSVVIVTYNANRYIAMCLDSISDQSYGNTEVLVVDNASTDETCLRVLRHRATPNLIRLNRNEEFCRANNIGIARSRGEYVLILNQDVELECRFVEKLVRAFEADPCVGVAGGKLLRTLGTSSPVQPLTIDNAGGHLLMRSYVTRDRGYGQHDVGQFDTEDVAFSASGAAAMFRRAALESVKYKGQYFDEAFVAYKEDVDICWRCRALGWRVKYIPSAVGYHVRGWAGKAGSITSRKGVPLARRFHSFKNRYLLVLKNESVSGFISNLPWVIWYEIRAIVFAALFERRLLLAIPRVITLLPDSIRKRKHLKDQRKRYRVGIATQLEGTPLGDPNVISKLADLPALRSLNRRDGLRLMDGDDRG